MPVVGDDNGPLSIPADPYCERRLRFRQGCVSMSVIDSGKAGVGGSKDPSNRRTMASKLGIQGDALAVEVLMEDADQGYNAISGRSRAIVGCSK